MQDNNQENQENKASKVEPLPETSSDFWDGKTSIQSVVVSNSCKHEDLVLNWAKREANCPLCGWGCRIIPGVHEMVNGKLVNKQLSKS